ncbi:MAG: hypothetical protein QCI38_07065, partial [Candidatus Thermoplasmatota archaeon]|nr:hypothetical protein [Candidatus Thermoplasmatota archaeon]
KQIHVGMFEYRHLRYQVLDTPGLLDRPLEERNDIERQAILALKHLPHLVVFVLDPTEECGTSLQEQKHLYQAIKENFGRTQHILIYNKTDLMEPPEGEIGVSALTGAGIENLREEIARRLAPIHLERDPVESYQG